MAFSVKVVGLSKDTGKPQLEMEPPWWDSNILRKDARFIESNETGSYLDYDADLSIKEMIELHEKFRESATSGIYEYHKWREIIEPMIQKIDEALYLHPDKYSHFHVTVFEWESGLG